MYKNILGLLLLILCAYAPETATAQQSCGPLTRYINADVPEASSGFCHPLNVAEALPGWRFTDWAGGYSCGYVYHPGRDINAAPGDNDLGTPVSAVANGRVVYAKSGSWGGVVIQHKYRGITYFSQYGHVQGIRVTCGQTVTQGQQIAEIGKVGTSSAHLHFEIREGDHPDATRGDFFPCYLSLTDVLNWYEDPVPFTQTHGGYTSSTPYVWRFDVTGYSEEWSPVNVSGSNVSGGAFLIDPKGARPVHRERPARRQRLYLPVRAVEDGE